MKKKTIKDQPLKTIKMRIMRCIINYMQNETQLRAMNGFLNLNFFYFWNEKQIAGISCRKEVLLTKRT